MKQSKEEVKTYTQRNVFSSYTLLEEDDNRTVLVYEIDKSTGNNIFPIGTFNIKFDPKSTKDEIADIVNAFFDEIAKFRKEHQERIDRDFEKITLQLDSIEIDE